MQSLNIQILRLLRARSSLTFRQLTAAASAADVGIHKKIISNDEMEDIIKIAKSLEDSGLK